MVNWKGNEVAYFKAPPRCSLEETDQSHEILHPLRSHSSRLV